MSSKKSTAAPAAGTTLDAATLVNQVESVFTDADALRASGATNLAMVRTARVNVLQRVRDGLAAKLGTNAPEVTTLDGAIADDTALATALSAQGDLASKPPVVADDHETVVQGFVRDAAGKAAAGVKVALAQPKGEPLATATTGKDGHFLLRARAGTKAEVPTAIELRVHDKRHPAPVELERGNGVVFTSVRLEA
jgi:hypothetical protein